MFFVWFSANLNVLAYVSSCRPSHSLQLYVCVRMLIGWWCVYVRDRFSTGTVGPTVFGLGIKESFTVIIIVDLMCVYSSISNFRYLK